MVLRDMRKACRSRWNQLAAGLVCWLVTKGLVLTLQEFNESLLNVVLRDLLLQRVGQKGPTLNVLRCFDAWPMADSDR